MTRPERWLLLEVALPERGAAEEAGEALRRAAARALLELGASAVEETPGGVRTHLRAPPDPEEAAERARRHVARDAGREPEVRWRWVEDRDWSRVWRRGLGPRRVGRRLVVAPGWTDASAGPGDLVVRIDPGMAFGTGEHGSTRGALRLLEAAVTPGDRVLDLGTGSGVLAVAAAKLGASRVVAVEKDPDAAASAADNVRRNGAGEAVRLLETEADAEVVRLLAPPPFDVTVANILAPVLGPLAAPFRDVAAVDGRLILGGILEEEAADVLGTAEAAGWRWREEDRDDGWWTGLFAAAGPARAARPPDAPPGG